MALLDVQAIRSDFPLGTVAGAVMHLRPVAGELRGCCPFHPDNTPSFYVFAGGDRAHCFGCNWTGDVLDFVRCYYQLDSIREAATQLYGGELPVVEAPSVNAKAERDNSFALGLWRSAAVIEGTPAQAYLRRRGIMGPLPSSLRYAMLKPPKESGVALANGRKLLPAMVALVTAPDGEPSGIQRTFLTLDGHKAATTDGKVKYSLGNLIGGAIHLGPAIEHGLAVTEGVEDSLSLIEMGAASAWAAAGTSMLSRIRLPGSVRSVVIGADNGFAGHNAAREAADAFSRDGREVRIVYPPEGVADWNDELRGVAA